MTKSTPLAFASALVLLAAASSCREAAAPTPAGHQPGTPMFAVTGPQAAIQGVGALGPATIGGPGADREDFDFNVGQDLTGRLVYNDWRYNAWIKVDPADAQTSITAFRSSSAQCSDPAAGAEVDGVGRRENGALDPFTLVACDLGAAESDADFFSMTFTTRSYNLQGNLTSGDIVKTVAQQVQTGNLDVTTSTTGSSLPSGYSVAVDGGSSQPIGINATASFTALTAGNHSVVLSDVPANCTVSGGATQTVTVASGQTATAAYSVSCVTPNGSLNVTTTTSGSSLPSGYTVTVDAASRPIGINATESFTDLAAGSHTVVLSGIPSNCTVSGGATQTVTVPSAQTATASYSVSCVTPPGNLNVTTATSGSSLPSGYTVTVDANASRSIGINATQSFTGLTPGSHTVVLSGVPSNCTLNGAATRTVTVTSAQTVSTSYAVSCITPNTTPTVNAGPDQRILLGVLYQLHWSFSDPDNGPWNYTINWGDGSSSSGTLSSAGSYGAGHTYILGTYTIRVTVTDARGASMSDTKRLSVVTGLLGF